MASIREKAKEVQDEISRLCLRHRELSWSIAQARAWRADQISAPVPIDDLKKFFSDYVDHRGADFLPVLAREFDRFANPPRQPNGTRQGPIGFDELTALLTERGSNASSNIIAGMSNHFLRLFRPEPARQLDDAFYLFLGPLIKEVLPHVLEKVNLHYRHCVDGDIGSDRESRLRLLTEADEKIRLMQKEKGSIEMEIAALGGSVPRYDSETPPQDAAEILVGAVGIKNAIAIVEWQKGELLIIPNNIEACGELVNRIGRNATIALQKRVPGGVLPIPRNIMLFLLRARSSDIATRIANGDDVVAIAGHYGLEEKDVHLLAPTKRAGDDVR